MASSSTTSSSNDPTGGNVASTGAAASAAVGNRGDDGVDGGALQVHVYNPNGPTVTTIDNRTGSFTRGEQLRYDSDSDMMVSLRQLLQRLRGENPDFPEAQAQAYFDGLPLEPPMLDAAGPAIPLRPQAQKQQPVPDVLPHSRHRSSLRRCQLYSLNLLHRRQKDGSPIRSVVYNKGNDHQLHVQSGFLQLESQRCRTWTIRLLQSSPML